MIYESKIHSFSHISRTQWCKHYRWLSMQFLYFISQAKTGLIYEKDISQRNSCQWDEPLIIIKHSEQKWKLFFISDMCTYLSIIKIMLKLAIIEINFFSVNLHKFQGKIILFLIYNRGMIYLGYSPIQSILCTLRYIQKWRICPEASTPNLQWRNHISAFISLHTSHFEMLPNSTPGEIQSWINRFVWAETAMK